MKITSLRIRTLKNTGNKMQGVASITLDNMIAIHDIKILRNSDGLFLAMPSKTVKPGTFKDSVHPINAQVRESIERIIFSAYELCSKSNHGSAQFDVLEEFSETLLEQTFSDFHLVSSEAYKFATPNEIFREEDDVSEAPESRSKKGNAFLDWLNN